MSRTLRFGTDPARLDSAMSRIDRFVTHRRTPASYCRLQELAAADYARHVAAEVTVQAMGRRTRLVTPSFGSQAPGFGKRCYIRFDQAVVCEDCCPEGQCIAKRR